RVDATYRPAGPPPSPRNRRIFRITRSAAGTIRCWTIAPAVLTKESSMRSLAALFLASVILSAIADGPPAPAQGPTTIKILFLGDKGHHQPELRFKTLEPVLAARGIQLTYVGSANALTAETLAKYDGLMIYANIEKITPEQEKALLDYVEGGKGLIALHCASYCFLNSPKYIALVGGQFKSHGTGTFKTTGAGVEHPITAGLAEIESWDETYVHSKHNDKD